jgi:hypothetical protein
LTDQAVVGAGTCPARIWAQQTEAPRRPPGTRRKERGKREERQNAGEPAFCRKPDSPAPLPAKTFRWLAVDHRIVQVPRYGLHPPVAAGVPAGRPETHTRPRTLKGESRAVISQALADVMKPGSEERLWKLNKQEPRRGGPTGVPRDAG